MNSRLLLSIVATAALTACGGGGGGGGGGVPILPPVAPAPAPPPAPPAPAPAPAPPPAPAPVPIALKPMYEALAPATTQDAFLAQANAQGARGFRFLSGMGFGDPANLTVSHVFVKDLPTTYAFEARSTATSAAELQDQLNAQGARGFRWAGPYTAGSSFFELYRQEPGSATNYSYTVVPAVASTAEFLVEANGLGASGYYLTGPAYFVGPESRRIYERASSGSGTYVYEALDEPGSADGFLAQLNAQGARGFRLRSALIFSEGTRLVYEKDSAQSAQFAYHALNPSDSSAAFVAQANAEGERGATLAGDYVALGSAARTYYLTPSACTGILCLARGPFGG